MLHRLEIANFYSIRNSQVIDLRAASNAPDEPGRLAPIWPGASERAPKVVALFGANASGKSNVLKALSFLTWFAKDSFQLHPLGPNSYLPYTRFNDEEMLSSPTRLAVYFQGPVELEHADDPDTKQCRYAYEVLLGGPASEPPHVLNEKLTYWPTRRSFRLFDRDEKGTVHAGKAFSLAGYTKALGNILRPNVSVICTLAQLRHPAATVLWSAAANISYNILTDKFEFDDKAVALAYSKDQTLLERLNRDLERIGLGVRAMQLQGSPDAPVVWFEHEGMNRTVAWNARKPWHTASLSGTSLSSFSALKTGSIAIIDELDLAIHPLVLPEIVRWFHDPERNPHNAQLWMTCQNASLLEELIKEEVLLCEKDREGRTTVYSLRNVQAVRRSDNYYRKYLGGVYGAVPHLG